ncbi:MAG: hypothetical protein DVB31_02635 [Verrucomicrobia bacterium]|nr:MAG: hypothetical protein DVB31_02635 [Verrucomicrobiota bacterium]
MRRPRTTVVVSGMIAADPFQGGASWAVLQYVLGLQRLGYEVHLVEPIPTASIQPPGTPLGESLNEAYFHRVAEEYGLERHATLLHAGTRETVGMPYDELRALCRRAAVLLNVSGMLADPELVSPIPIRVYLDLDPAFNQLWHAAEGIDMRFAAHTHFATVGQEVGSDACPVPTCGRDWIPTLPPVVLDRWPVAGEIRRDAWTTVANWRGYGSIEHGGVHHGQKAHSFRRLMELPGRTTGKFAVALSIHPGETRDVTALGANGWEILDPIEAAGTPWHYARFVAGSRGEIGIAKSGYVASRCGWFSDRSACYLACGRPVIAQETGFGRHLPTGSGLLSFGDIEGATDATARVRADYAVHARAARAVAEEYLDSDRVLGRLLGKVGAPC